MLRARCARVHNRLHATSTHLLELVVSDLFSLETYTCPFPSLLLVDAWNGGFALLSFLADSSVPFVPYFLSAW